MKAVKRKSRLKGEFPHVVRKRGHRSAWRSEVQISVGEPHAQFESTVVLSHPEPFDAQGNLSAGARELLLKAAARTARGADHPSICIVWRDDCCTFVGPAGEQHVSDRPPLTRPFYVQFEADLPPLKLERCFSVPLPDCGTERYICAQRIGRLVEIVEGEHMVLGDLHEDDIPTDARGEALSDADVLRRLPKTYRGAPITGYIAGGILGPIQPAELARPIVLNDPWPSEVAQACEEVAGFALPSATTNAIWDAVRERQPTLLRAA